MKQSVIDSYHSVKSEWQRFSDQVQRRPRVDLYKIYENGTLVPENPDDWSVVSLIARGQRQWYNSLFFPKTMTLARHIGVKDNMMFSIFAPRMRTPEHSGHSTDVVRCHLGIVTNADQGLCVGNEFQQVRDGEFMMFDDSRKHWAYNDHDQERVVLLFDLSKKDLGIS